MTILNNDLKSSYLASCSYDTNTNVLTVVFQNGKEYLYADVPLEIYTAFTAAESPGKYFGSEIKGKYEAPKE